MYSLLCINNNEYIILNQSDFEVITRRTAVVNHNGFKTIATMVDSGSKSKMLKLMKQLTKVPKKEPKGLKNPDAKSSGRNFIPCGAKKKIQSDGSRPAPVIESQETTIMLPSANTKPNIDNGGTDANIMNLIPLLPCVSDSGEHNEENNDCEDKEQENEKGIQQNDYENKKLEYGIQDVYIPLVPCVIDSGEHNGENNACEDEKQENEDGIQQNNVCEDKKQENGNGIQQNDDCENKKQENGLQDVRIPLVPRVTDSGEHNRENNDCENKKQKNGNGVQQNDNCEDEKQENVIQDVHIPLVPCVTDSGEHHRDNNDCADEKQENENGSQRNNHCEDKKQENENGIHDVHIVHQEVLNADSQNDSAPVIEVEETIVILTPSNTDPDIHDGGSRSFNIMNLIPFVVQENENGIQDVLIAVQDELNAEIEECRQERSMTSKEIAHNDEFPNDEDAEVLVKNISAEDDKPQSTCSNRTSLDENGKRRSLQEIIRDEYQDFEEDFTQTVLEPATTMSDVINQLDDPELNDFIGYETWKGHDFADEDIFINPNDVFNESPVSTLIKTVNEKMEDKKKNEVIIGNGDSSSEDEQDYGNNGKDGSNISYGSSHHDLTWKETSQDEGSTEAVNTTAEDTENADTEAETSHNSSIEPKVSCKTGAIDKQCLKVNPKMTKSKLNFCVYCNKLQSVISRHLENVHRDKSPVKKFHNLPKSNPERRKIIETLRLKGNVIYNTDAQLNKTGEMLVARRPKEERPGSMYEECHNCGVYLSVKTSRRHRQSCLGPAEKGTRGNKILSRFVEGRIHKDASERLAAIFSILREDEVVLLIRYDELLIRFGNCLAEKYLKIQQADMIRNRLRTLGRLLKIMKELDPNITDFKSIYHPKLYRVMLEAVRKMAGFNAAEGECDVPSIVTTVGTYIKAVGEVLKLYWIENMDEENEKMVEKYLFLHKMWYSQAVNRVALEDQAKKHRQNVKPLPTTDDVQKLSDYVNAKRTEAMEELEERYTYDAWLRLSKYLLISVQIFNRKRAGEIERTLISDLKSTEKITEKDHPEIYKELSEEQKTLAEEYSRFMITGKLSSNVAVLLDAEMERCFGVVLTHRKSAKVPAKNPYIFGIPGYADGRFKYLRACKLMNEFSEKCNATNPERLRGTFLRKQLATTCAANNMDENQIVDIANFMGHHEKIHRSHYRHSVVTRDVIGVAKVLRKAMGDDIENKNPGPSNQPHGSSAEDDPATRPEADCASGDTSGDNAEESATSSYSQTCPKRTTKRKRARVMLMSTSSDESDSKSNTLPRKRQKTNKKCKNGRKENSDGSGADGDTPPCEQKKKNLKAHSSKRNESHDGGKKQKKRWTDEEKELAFRRFGEMIRNNRLPSTNEIRKFLKDNPTMDRTVDQIRTWASNEKKKWNMGL